ncbi:PIN domain-containing protein [Mesorhizobium sp.]|uniref:PIN domain-containing protein n=1 Tax=Mesorhizobium sp. TaxID=1871066 RepID=UPI0025BA1C8E|nr:PIN domain-containing protein [Mesorhizobium sp.]
MKGRPEVRKRLEAQQISAIRLSAGELEFGAEKSAYGDRNRARLATLTQRLPLVGIDQDTIRHYAKIRAFLERHGTLIGANDTWIAAQALAINAVLVTDNEREFSRVPGLVVENWLTDTES